MPEDVPLTGNIFVAAGENGLRVFSVDGVHWTHQQLDREGMLLNHACIDRGRCLVLGKFGGDSVAWSTSDGVSWTQNKLNTQAYAGKFGPVFSADGQFQVVANDDGAIPGLRTSPDGTVWTPRKPLMDGRKGLKNDAGLRRLARGNNRLVIIGDYGARLVRHPDQTLFEAVLGVPAKETLVDIAFGNGVFVGGGMHGLRMRSVDGFTWTDIVTGEEGEHINAMIWDGRQFVGIGQGATYRSVDGQTWIREPNENAPTNAVFGAGNFVGILWPGKQLISKDGIYWSQVHEFPQHVLALAYGSLHKS